MILRKFEENSFQCNVYKEMYAKQSLEFRKTMIEKYSNLNNGTYSIKEVLKLLDNFVDPSDPDVSLPNSIHAYQTAERIRKTYPNDHQLQLCGLIHDLGKILYKFGEPSCAIVGDTFVLGCKIPDSVVYYEYAVNCTADCSADYAGELGIYKKNCGVENLNISFGHDEYMYMVLKNNKNHNFEDKYKNMIRFHSFYPWHSNGEYQFFNSIEDEFLLEDVKLFNKFDLYSKEDDLEMLCTVDVDGNYVIREEIEEYYDNLIFEYFPEKLRW